MARYDIDVFSEALGQWQYAHTYDLAAGSSAEDVITTFVANNPHRKAEHVRATLRTEQTPA